MDLQYLILATIFMCFLGSLKAQDTDSETSVNERTNTSTAGLYGSDVKLTQAQIMAIQMDIQFRKTQSSLGGVQNAVFRENFNNRWENGVVPYTIDSSFDSRALARQRINEAIALYDEETCIRFIPRTNELDYVRIITGSGCYSYLGRIGGPQDISIGIGCESVGTIVHEFFHALGRFHEQSRYDRDQFVTINRLNIRPGFESNFDEVGDTIVTLQGIPYDYRSVMHYSAFAFAVDRSIPTITPVDNSVDLSDLGQRNGFTDSDILHANLLYCKDSINMGTWSEWSSFSACSRTCNGGTQVRTRTCQNGDACEGQNSQERSCNTEDCVVEPTWGQWSSWSACSDSCGTGTRMRSRQCLNGNTCDTKQGSGTNMDIENCNTQECPIPATWGPWGSWGSCSRTCATGTQTRQRNCMNGNTCGNNGDGGLAVDIRECNGDIPCTVDPSSGEWSQWSSCSVSCGGGSRTRTRMCTDTNTFDNCDTQRESCNEDECVNVKPTLGLVKYGCFYVPTFATELISLEDSVPELSDNPFTRVDPINKCGIASLEAGYRILSLTLGICISGSNNVQEYTRIQVPPSYCGTNEIGGFAYGFFYMTVYEIVNVQLFSDTVQGITPEPSPSPSPTDDDGVDRFSGASFMFPSIIVISLFILLASLFILV